MLGWYQKSFMSTSRISPHERSFQSWLYSTKKWNKKKFTWLMFYVSVFCRNLISFSELENEFLSSDIPSVQKPAIQPLENILANLKTTPTFKPTNQQQDLSKEATRIVQSLPDLSFMKSKVLMFPVKMSYDWVIYNYLIYIVLNKCDPSTEKGSVCWNDV